MILILAFGAIVAGLVPLLMAIVSIIVALGLCALVVAAFTLQTLPARPPAVILRR